MTAAQVFNGAVNVPTNASNLATACALCSHNCGLRVDVADNKLKFAPMMTIPQPKVILVIKPMPLPIMSTMPNA